MKIVATIEARMGSTRLPGKVLQDLGGLPSLECQIKRLQKSKLINEIVLATTYKVQDAPLVSFAKNLKIPYFCGDENDILGRILGAAKSVGGELQVQITGDCPLIDAQIVDQVIEKYLAAKGGWDFVSNEIERSYPIGLDCRVFSVALLEKVDKLCQDPMHRVHGSTYIYAGPGKDKYKSSNIHAPPELFFPTWRWTLDTPEDLKFFQTLFQQFGKERMLSLSGIELATWLQKHPEVVAINNSVRQKTIEEGG